MRQITGTPAPASMAVATTSSWSQFFSDHAGFGPLPICHHPFRHTDGNVAGMVSLKAAKAAVANARDSIDTASRLSAAALFLGVLALVVACVALARTRRA